MKYFWLFLGIIFLVALLILYFQLIVGVMMQVPFFSVWVDIDLFTLYLILLAFFSGIFITISVHGFMSGSNTIDDDFDL